MAIETVGRVVDGRIVVDDYPLVEGSLVRVIIGDEIIEQRLTPEMQAELDESIAQADRGEFVSWEELRTELRRIERGEQP